MVVFSLLLQVIFLLFRAFFLLSEGGITRCPLLPGKPRPSTVHPLAIGVVLGTIEVVEPLLFRSFHHECHQSPEDEGQYKQPEVAGEQGYADADEHPARVERVAPPGRDSFRIQAVVLAPPVTRLRLQSLLLP